MKVYKVKDKYFFDIDSAILNTIKKQTATDTIEVSEDIITVHIDGDEVVLRSGEEELIIKTEWVFNDAKFVDKYNVEEHTTVMWSYGSFNVEVGFGIQVNLINAHFSEYLKSEITEAFDKIKELKNETTD